jgi:Tol biopolymer transport system component
MRNGQPAVTGDWFSFDPQISADGSQVVFDDTTTDLVSGVTGGGASNVFSYVTATGTLALVSHMNGAPLTATGGGIPQVSVDGRWIAFALAFQRRQTKTGTFTLPLATNGAGTLALLPTVASHGTVHVVVEVEGFTP